MDLLIILGVVFVANIVLTWGYIKYMNRAQILAQPTDRGLHNVSKPTSGGWPLMVLSLAGWAYMIWPFEHMFLILFLCTIGLALVSWWDDIAHLPPLPRFAAQFIAVSICLWSMPDNQTVFSAQWPLIVDRLLTGLCWLWFINLFNFMDGIDGIAGVETVSISLGVFLLSLLVPQIAGPYQMLVAILAIATIAYLFFNWHPSKVMMGDVGSISIGFLLGWILIQVAAAGYIIAALILPLYFLADATLTLFRRIARGEKPWQAHREHYYQQAVLSGRSHSEIVLRIIPANILLVGAALISLSQPIIGFLLALAIVAAILVHLKWLGDAPLNSPARPQGDE